MPLSLNGSGGITYPDGTVNNTRSVSVAGDTMTGGLTLGGQLNLGSNGQIVFPVNRNASTNANTLDDYEEGTWTPTLVSSGTSPTVSSYMSRFGIYSKVGNLVTATCNIRATITNIGTGIVKVSGLPFANTNQIEGVALGIRGLMNNRNPPYYYVDNTDVYFDSVYIIATNDYITFTVSYRTNN